LSSGQAVEAKDVMSILVAASYTEHPDEFWTRTKLILDSVENTHAVFLVLSILYSESVPQTISRVFFLFFQQQRQR
jgi:hypothetical protein